MGGGGGGAGGAIRVVAANASLGSNLVVATGGGGGNCSCMNSYPPAGSGGSGRIGIKAGAISGTTNPTYTAM
jgi:hypothetical protein